MIDQQIIDLVSQWIANYGAWVLGIYLIFASGGLPLPASPLLLLVGALARQGFININSVFIWSFIGSITGDIASYLLGRFAGEWADRHIARRFGETWHKAQAQFNRFGSWMVFLSRWLITSLDVPINFIVGASHYDFKKFLVASISGRILWLVIYLGVGYSVSSQFELIVQIVSSYAAWLAGFIFAAFIVFLVIRYLLRNKTKISETFLPAAKGPDSNDS